MIAALDEAIASGGKEGGGDAEKKNLQNKNNNYNSAVVVNACGRVFHSLLVYSYTYAIELYFFSFFWWFAGLD